MIFVFREFLREIGISDDEVNDIADLCGDSCGRSRTMIVLEGSSLSEILWDRHVGSMLTASDVRGGVLVVGGLASPRRHGVTEICEEGGYARGPQSAEAEHLLGQMLVEGVDRSIASSIAVAMSELVLRRGGAHRTGGLMDAFDLGVRAGFDLAGRIDEDGKEKGETS